MKNRNTILIILTGITLAVLLYFLLHEPKPTDSHKSEYDKVVADNKAFQRREDSILRRSDSLEQSGRSKDSAIAALQAERKATQKEYLRIIRELLELP